MRRLLLLIPFILALTGLALVDGVRYAMPVLSSDPDAPHASIIPRVSTCDTIGNQVCIGVLTGTSRAVYRISNPDGVTGFEEYHLVNFDQTLLASSPTSIDVEVKIDYWVDTKSPYPVIVHELPTEIRDAYLQSNSAIQSDHPEIVAKARELVAEATRQAEAVESIVMWVRGNVEYDVGLPADALSVFRNGGSSCGGFSNLTVALLRAAGIPSRIHVGCATPYPYTVSEGGGWHVWVEVYYSDVGWVASEPQDSANYILPGVIHRGFDQCGAAATVISRTQHTDDSELLHSIRTPYYPRWPYLVGSASIPDRRQHHIQVSTESPTLLVSSDAPTGVLALGVLDLKCGTWQPLLASTNGPWLTGYRQETARSVSFQVDGTGMSIGTYQTEIDLYTSKYVVPRTILVTLVVADSVQRVYLPTTLRHYTGSSISIPSCQRSESGMVMVPEGEFLMGCDDAHPPDEFCTVYDALHPVYLDAYQLDQYEVTNGQYEECVAAGGCSEPTSTEYGFAAYADRPIVGVTWHQADSYCRWAGKRLPTEAEWEKAARGGGDTRNYPWGNEEPDCSRANFEEWRGPCIGYPREVGSYPTGVSPYCVFDMAGNAMEWTHDWVDWDYYLVSPYENPQGPDTGDFKISRGGSYGTRTRYDLGIDIVRRSATAPEYAANDLGFRCAMDAPGE